MGRTPKITDNNGRESLIEFWFRVQNFLRVRTRIARAAGLHSREYELLLAVKAVPPGEYVSVSLMAEALLLQHPVTTGLVKSLVAKGLLRADPNPRDKRSLALKLTSRGEKLLHDIVAQSVERLEAEAPGLSASLQKTLLVRDSGTLDSAPRASRGRNRK